MTTDDDVSRQLVDAGLPAAIFSGVLRHPLGSYTFAVARDTHGRLWITARKDGGVNMCLLHEPPEPVGTRLAVLTGEQWELARSVAAGDEEPDPAECPFCPWSFIAPGVTANVASAEVDIHPDRARRIADNMRDTDLVDHLFDEHGIGSPETLREAVSVLARYVGEDRCAYCGGRRNHCILIGFGDGPRDHKFTEPYLRPAYRDGHVPAHLAELWDSRPVQ